MKRLTHLIVLASFLIPIVSLAGGGHDSVVFLIDVSGTVSGSNSIGEAKQITQDMNSRFPDYVRSSGVLTFGNNQPPQLEWLMPVSDWSDSGLDGALGKLEEGNGPSPMGAALTGVKPGLKQAVGKTALIIVSDGLDNGGSDPVKRADALKSEFGANLCIFTIQLGDDPEGGALLDRLVDAGQCGTASKASGLRSDSDVQALVNYIFPGGGYVPPPPPPKPQPKAEPMIGDEDGDGVKDPDDECKGTLRGANVDRRGCWVLRNVKFDSGQAEIKPQYYNDLDNVVWVLKNNPSVSIVIQGHTDSQGSEESNQALSQKRAEAVMKYITDKGVSSSRLTAKGYGESRPIADNETAEGRAENRRIELEVTQ